MQDEYQPPQQMKRVGLDMSRFQVAKSKETWEGVQIVDYFATQFEIPATGHYGYTSWLRRVKGMNLHQAKRLVEIMEDTEQWLLKTKGEKMHRGKWMFNRFRYEIKEKGVDKYIASKSR